MVAHPDVGLVAPNGLVPPSRHCALIGAARDDLASMVRSALADSRRGYVLTYAPSDLQDDGKFHGIRLRTARRGVQLRYRLGYCADTQEGARR